jgi:hypothetical protein
MKTLRFHWFVPDPALPLARTDNRVWTLDGRGVSTTPCRALTGPMGSGSPPCAPTRPKLFPSKITTSRSVA